MTKAAAHKWAFAPGFHRHAFNWRSQGAVQRVRDATAEIEKAKPFRPNSRRKAYRDLSSSLRAL
jgi:hypothetical protein